MGRNVPQQSLLVSVRLAVTEQRPVGLRAHRQQITEPAQGRHPLGRSETGAQIGWDVVRPLLSGTEAGDDFLLQS